MRVYVIGNQLIKEDGVPVSLLPILKKTFPHILFEHVDPNENFVPEEGSIIIDSVEGIDDLAWFDDVNAFVITRSVTPHDYDLGFHLQLLKKLHKLPQVKILGIPLHAHWKDMLPRVSETLRAVLI